MHLKRTHGAINKIISVTDAIISDTGEAVNALTHPETNNMSSNTSRLKTRIWNKEIFENDKINFEEATTLDNDNN